jgi:VWFA-related protein
MIRIPRATVGAALLFGVVATAQAPQQPTFRTGTNVVQVDVIVTDADGRPVDDLTADDFQVLDDGHAVPVTAFRFLNAAQAEASERYPVRTADDEEREAAHEEARLFAILLDDYHISRFSPLRIKEPLIAMVRALPPTDLVAAFYPLDSPRDVRFTYEREPVIAAIRKLEGRYREYLPKHPVEEEHLRYPRDIERLRTQVVLTGATSIASRLGALKTGRKTLVWITEGFTGAGYDGLGLFDDLRDVYQAGNRNNVSIYPVDPRGLMMSTPRFQHDTLRLLAFETGGRAIVNHNELKRPLLDIPRESAAYYLIGFVSTQPADGKFHRITVRTSRPRLTIRARAGYWALSETELASSRAAPIAVPEAITEAFKQLAEALRPDLGESTAAVPAQAVVAEGARVLAPPSLTVLRGASMEQAVSRPEFTRAQRISVRAAIAGGPTPVITVQLLDRLGRVLTTLPATVTEAACEVTLALGSLGHGDYVIRLQAQRGDDRVEHHVALRVTK